MNSVFFRCNLIATLILSLLGSPCATLSFANGLHGELAQQNLPQANLIDPANVGIRDFTKLASSLQPKNSMGVNLKQLFPNKNRVIIGIEKPVHTFLVVGDIRYDGRLLHLPAAVSYSKSAEIPASEGVFAELSNLPPETIQKLKQLILEKPKVVSLTCTNAVHTILTQAGITVNVPNSGEFMDSGEFMKHLAENHLAVKNHGNIEVRIHLTPDSELKESINSFTRIHEMRFNSVKKRFANMSPDEVVQTINGESIPISDNVRKYWLNITEPSTCLRNLVNTMMPPAAKEL